MRAARALLAAALCAPAAGCVSGSAKLLALREDLPDPVLVALLPPDNQSLDLTAPYAVRRMYSGVLSELGMVPVCSPAQDEQLRELGVSDGGQLAAFEPSRLAATLGVDGLLYTTIRQFREADVGLLSDRVVETEARLVDARGVELWRVEGRGGRRTPRLGPGGAGAQKAATLAEKLTSTHLLYEAMLMREQLLRELPRRPR